MDDNSATTGLVVIDLTSPVPDPSFAAWLLRQRNGQLHQELTEALSRLSLAVADTSLNGELTLKVKLRLSEDNAEQLLVFDLVTLKEPRRPTPAHAFWFDEDTLSLSSTLPLQQNQLPESAPSPLLRMDLEAIHHAAGGEPDGQRPGEL